MCNGYLTICTHSFQKPSEEEEAAPEAPPTMTVSQDPRYMKYFKMINMVKYTGYSICHNHKLLNIQWLEHGKHPPPPALFIHLFAGWGHNTLTTPLLLPFVAATFW